MKKFNYLGLFFTLGLLIISCAKDSEITELANEEVIQEQVMEWGGLEFNQNQSITASVTTRDGSNEILVFDEIPRQSIDGVSVGGVNFNFEINGVSSNGANYNSGGPGASAYWSCPCIEGPSEGTLIISFDSPTKLVEFGMARSTFSVLTPGFTVLLKDDSGATIDEIDVNNSPVEPSPFTGALFSYLSTGESIKSLEVTFSTPSTRFAFDNLVYQIVQDSDGDGVLDTDDNCPDIPNPDQANNDGDTEGDVCDDDDDNDGVLDTEDNCQFVANADQADYEGDGIGDLCDSDDDNDGVNDVDDNHPMSNLEPTVIIDGCDSGVSNMQIANGSNMSDLIADCAVSANNHGEFVSCVAALTNSWKSAGLISGQQKGAIQSCAGESSYPL